MAPPFEPTRKRDYVLADFRKGAEYLLSNTRHRPKIAVILGSGLSELVRALEDADNISYEKVHEALPYFPTCSVPGHKGNFVFGCLDGVSIMIMQGRFHLYGKSRPAILVLLAHIFLTTYMES
jgi:purine-nucleoside phosphorylase